MLSFVFIYCALYLMIPHYILSSWLLQTLLDCDRFWVFLFLMNLTVLKHIGQVFCRMPLNWNLSDIYLMITVGLYVFVWMTTEIKYHSHHIISRVHIFNMTSLLMCTLTTWLEVVLDRLLHFLSFLIPSYMERNHYA